MLRLSSLPIVCHKICIDMRRCVWVVSEHLFGCCGSDYCPPCSCHYLIPSNLCRSGKTLSKRWSFLKTASTRTLCSSKRATSRSKPVGWAISLPTIPSCGHTVWLSCTLVVGLVAHGCITWPHAWGSWWWVQKVWWFTGEEVLYVVTCWCDMITCCCWHTGFVLSFLPLPISSWWNTVLALHRTS